MNVLDRIIGYLSPARGAARLCARATMEQIEAFTGGKGGYQAGKLNRLNNYFGGSNASENALPREEIARLRWSSWDLFRNNPHAKKIVRSLEAKVIGRGMQPQSQALRDDGSPHVEFRDWAQDLWGRIANQFDVKGTPGRGGLSLTELQKAALRSAILGGEAFYSLKAFSRAKQIELGLAVPLQLQLIHPERLDSSQYWPAGGQDSRIEYGIELSAAGQRLAYWFLNRHPAEGLAEVTRMPAAQVGHLYIADDIDQLRGVPWFAAALMQMRDTGDYQANELKASALAACVTLGIRLPTGATSFGVQDPNQPSQPTDTAGNPLTKMQAGMILNLGQDGAIEGFNPSRPSTNAEAWIQHMIRSTATALPGVKASTLTGDYRNSSFSSERSADNDVWPELLGVQDWFAAGFCQPIYEEAIRSAVLSGYFAEIISDEEFADREQEFLAANWQGPVALSINPTDDATAAALRVKAGISSPQIEAAKVGRDWRQIVADLVEFQQYTEAQGLPEQLSGQVLGLPAPVVQQAAPQNDEDETTEDDEQTIAAAA